MNAWHRIGGGSMLNSQAQNRRNARTLTHKFTHRERFLLCCTVNVFTNGSQWCMLASCLFHLRLNCPSRTQIASSYSRLAVIAAHPEELFSASTLSLAPPRELPITFWHVTWPPLCPPYCYGGGDLTAAG